MANATAMSRVLDIVSESASKDRVVLISSAISGATDLLIKASKSENMLRSQALYELRLKHFQIIDRLFTGKESEEAKSEIESIHNSLIEAPLEDYETYGEMFSTKILARKLKAEGIATLWLNSVELVKCVDGKVDTLHTYRNIKAAVESHPDVKVFVAPGFIASDESGHVCTLGRGGSDYSAALYAAALNADSLQIWTDVPGIMTTNPKEVKAARTIDKISYEAAFCLALHGAKVLYAPTVEPAKKAKIDIQILNSLNPKQKGTVIKEYAQKSLGEWVGIA